MCQCYDYGVATGPEAAELEDIMRGLDLDPDEKVTAALLAAARAEPADVAKPEVYQRLVQQLTEQAFYQVWGPRTSVFVRDSLALVLSSGFSGGQTIHLSPTATSEVCAVGSMLRLCFFVLLLPCRSNQAAAGWCCPSPRRSPCGASCTSARAPRWSRTPAPRPLLVLLFLGDSVPEKTSLAVRPAWFAVGFTVPCGVWCGVAHGVCFFFACGRALQDAPSTFSEGGGSTRHSQPVAWRGCGGAAARGLRLPGQSAQLLRQLSQGDPPTPAAGGRPGWPRGSRQSGRF